MESITKRLAQFSTFVVDGARIILLIFLSVAAILFLAKALITIAVPFSLDYGEGPLLDQAVRLAAGQAIYTPDVSEPPYTITNYPPLFVLTIAPFVKIFGPSLFAGRLIALLAALATAVFLVLIVRTFTGDRLALAATAVIFLANPYVVQWAGLMRVDMLALALSMAALYLVVKWPTDRWSVIVAGLLLVAAIYTRQSYGLAAPLAAFVWLWQKQRRHALWLVAIVGGLGLALFALLNLLTRGGFFFHIVTANVNAFSGLNYWLLNLVQTLPVLLLLGAIFLIVGWRRAPLWSLLLPYLIGSFLTALTVGKIGSNVNYFMELSAALSMAAGLLIAWSREKPWLYAGLLILLVLQLGIFMRSTLAGPVADLTFRRRDASAMYELETLIAETADPVLADEFMSLLPLQERPIYLQPFEMTQLAMTGRWQQEGLLASIENQEFPLILIYQFPGYFYPVHLDRWSPEMLEAIEAYYRPVEILAGNILYRPLGEVGESSTAVPARNPTFTAGDLQVGAPTVIEQLPSSFLLPDIAANPNDSQHLAAGLMSLADTDCIPPDCQYEVGFFTSIDGGANWDEQTPIPSGRQTLQLAMVEFGTDDTLYAVSLRGRQPFINRTQGEPFAMTEQPSEISIISSPADPQLIVYPDNQRLIFAYGGRIQDNLGIRINRSPDQGESWVPSTNVDNGVPISEVNVARAIPPDNVQVLLGQGDELAVAWRWDAGFWDWPLGVWLAASNDGGDSFGEREKIADTWGPINSASHEGSYYILYRSGLGADQQLAVAVSADGGETWQASVASGDLALSYGFDHLSGFDIAPDGTLDIAFFAPEGDASTCSLDREEWINRFTGEPSDTCLYHLYYTFSRDGGQTFSEPVRLNQTPMQATNIPGHNSLTVALTSTDADAHVMWHEPLDGGSSQAQVVRIERK